MRAVLVGAALVWSVTSSLAIYPHSVSYFNELAAILPTPSDAFYPKPICGNNTRPVMSILHDVITAGSRNGPYHLLGSNVDIGQDLFYLKDWLNEHPDVILDGLAFCGPCPTSLVGLSATPEPPYGPVFDGQQMSDLSESQLGPKPGWYAVSVNYIFGREHQCRYFSSFEPEAMAGYSIYIYHITPDEANRVRRELGLSELTDDGEKQREWAE